MNDRFIYSFAVRWFVSADLQAIEALDAINLCDPQFRTKVNRIVRSNLSADDAQAVFIWCGGWYRRFRLPWNPQADTEWPLHDSVYQHLCRLHERAGILPRWTMRRPRLRFDKFGQPDFLPA